METVIHRNISFKHKHISDEYNLIEDDRKVIKVKVGLRTPSIKKSVRARTTGRIKRKVKRTVNPFYGKKGVGFIKNPKKSVKNKIYKKTTFGITDLFRSLFGGKKIR